MSCGLILLILGVLLLLENLGFLPQEIWGFFWPIIIILLGLTLLVKPKYNKFCCGKIDFKKDRKKEDEN